MSQVQRILFLAVIVASLALMGGCGDKITGGDVRADMSPELKSMAHNSEQLENRYARSQDTTLRQIWDDIDELLLRDKPSRLSRYPVP
jgi:hypothetical protein